MSNTTNLQLPFLAVGQAQKHVTVNETLRRLDAIVQLSVVSAATTTEPASPNDGDVYIVPAGKSGANWNAYANWSLGYYRDGAWEQVSPREGWIAFVRDSDQLLAYSGSAWSLFPAPKILTISATDKLVGRSSSGTGAAEEIACTAAGRALIDDADAAAQRTTLGLGTAATQNTGTSGANVPLLSQNNVFSGLNAFARSQPYVEIGDTIGSTDEKHWRHACYSIAPGQALYTLGSVNDSRTTGATALQFQRTGYAITAAESGADVRPLFDNSYALGGGSRRWSTVYAATGTINTSDAREKTELRPLGEAERRAIRRVVAGVGVYRWLEAVAKKGDGARLHVGVTAQAVEQAFAAEGLEASRYALFCIDSDEDGDRLGVRYDQLLAMALSTLFAD